MTRQISKPLSSKVFNCSNSKHCPFYLIWRCCYSDKNAEEAEERRRRGAGGHFPGPPWRFPAFTKQLTKGIRRSFRKVKSLRSRIRSSTAGKSAATTAATADDSGYRTAGDDKQEEEDTHSLDSGLESDESLELIPVKDKSFEDKCVQTWQPDFSDGWRDSSRPPDSGVDITRKSSNLSSRTADSGILSRHSPSSCLVTHKIHNVPKKRVSILLPGESSSSVFGTHLRVERTRLVDHAPPTLTYHQPSTVWFQRQELIYKARRALCTLHPDRTGSIITIFQAHADLRSLNIEEISDVLFNLRAILYSLYPVPYFETCVYMIQGFLLRVSVLVEDMPGLAGFPGLLEDLMVRSRTRAYAVSSFVLKETQTIYMDMWCSLITVF